MAPEHLGITKHHQSRHADVGLAGDIHVGACGKDDSRVQLAVCVLFRTLVVDEHRVIVAPDLLPQLLGETGVIFFVIGIGCQDG